MKNKPKFSIVLIARNEATVLPRLFQSLEEFKSRGGEVNICDTGSTDETVKIARGWGCNVKEVGDKYVHIITGKDAYHINKRFISDNEDNVVLENDKYFDFASARNDANSMSSLDWVCTVDADEILTQLDIDKINEIIESDPSIAHFEYNFVFSHMPDGSELIKFVQSKFYNRTRMFWKGIVHEMVTPTIGGARYFLGEEIFKLEHWQNEKTNRGQYLKGLAVDCFDNPDKDRNSHYFARELWWNGRPFSAAKEFIRHIKMNGWASERAESMLFLCDIAGAMGGMRKEEDEKHPDKVFKDTGNTDMYKLDSSLSSVELLERQLFWAHKALDTDPNRREPLIKLAQIYMRRGEWIPANFYATASLEIPWSGFYGSNKRFYENEPHEILYKAKGWIGDIEGAKKHLLICLDYQRENPEYLRDTQYYFDYAANNIPGWMSFEEQLFLFESAKKLESVIELGSWKGKSTYAICKSGCKDVTAIDTWMGSEFEPEAHAEAKSGTVFEEFKNNLKDFPDLKIIKADINEAVKDVPDKSVDMIFIDCGHTYEEVLNDIRKWKNKARILLCGHDYVAGWPGVIQAVAEELGGPDKVTGTIWQKWLV